MNDLCARDAKKLYYSIELRFIPCGSATPVMTHFLQPPRPAQRGAILLFDNRR
jgi:hypothetical protein